MKGIFGLFFVIVGATLLLGVALIEIEPQQKSGLDRFMEDRAELFDVNNYTCRDIICRDVGRFDYKNYTEAKEKKRDFLEFLHGCGHSITDTNFFTSDEEEPVYIKTARDERYGLTCDILTNGLFNISNNEWSLLKRNNSAFAFSLLQGDWECVYETNSKYEECMEGNNTSKLCKAWVDVNDYCTLYSNGIINATPEELERWGVVV